MSDIYEYTKSLEPQGLDTETPFVSKNWSYVNDVNTGVYTQNGQALVTFDLNSLIGESNDMQNFSEGYFQIPIVVASAYTTNNLTGTTTAPAATCPAWSSVIAKPHINLCHQADIQVQGQMLEQMHNYTNVKVQFKLLSTMSQDDLANYGSIIGMGNVIDNAKSMRFNGSSSTIYPSGTGGVFPTSNNAANAAPLYTGLPTTQPDAGCTGNGMTNNIPFFTAAGQNNDGDQNGVMQSAFTYNSALESRSSRLIDMGTGAVPANATFMYGGNASLSIMSLQNLQQEFRSSFIRVGDFMVWYDVFIIRAKDLFDSMAKLPLTRRLDAKISMYLNVGSTGVMLMNTIAGTDGAMIFSSGNNSFTGSCPYQESYLGGHGVIGTAAVGKSTMLGIAKVGGTGAFGVNFSSVQIPVHPMNSCRFSYPVYKVKPNILKQYLSINQTKSILYEKALLYNINNVSGGTSYSGQITAGVRQIKAMLIIPTLSATSNGLISGTTITGVQPFHQALSPFDSFPSTNGPFSLTNLNIQKGNVNVLSLPLNYTFQNFLEQFSGVNQINGSDFGLSCGLINDFYYQNAYRAYYFDLSRGDTSTQQDSAALSISFTNNTQQPLDLMIFTFSYQSAELDIITSKLNLL